MRRRSSDARRDESALFDEKAEAALLQLQLPFMSFFRPGPACAAYERIRDDQTEIAIGTRERIEALWTLYAPLCPDKGFCKNAMLHFNAGVWQMYLTCVLLDHGHAVEKSADGAPDIKIRRPDGSVLWIEATTAEAGSGPNEAKRVYSSDPSVGWAMVNIDEKKQILRYQNAIRLKAKHRDEFIQRGTIHPDDAYVIAINAADIDDADLPYGLPKIVRAVYPIGPLAFTYRAGTDYSHTKEEFPQERTIRTHTPSVKTPKGKDSSTQLFADGSLPGIAALLFSPLVILNAPIDAGREIISVYNFTAASPIAHDTFQFGESWHADGTHLHPTVWRKPLPEPQEPDWDP